MRGLNPVFGMTMKNGADAEEEGGLFEVVLGQIPMVEAEVEALRREHRTFCESWIR